MYIEKTPNGRYNVMQINEEVFNELLLLLKTYTRQKKNNINPPPGIKILPRLMQQEKDCEFKKESL